MLPLGLSASFVCPLADAAALSCHTSACLSLYRFFAPLSHFASPAPAVLPVFRRLL